MQYLNFKTMKVFKVAINYIITTKALKIMNKFISWFHDDSKKKISKICWYKFYSNKQNELSTSTNCAWWTTKQARSEDSSYNFYEPSFELSYIIATHGNTVILIM